MSGPDISLNNEFGKHFTQKSNVHMSLSADVLVVSEDKLTLCLKEHLQQLEAQRAWQFPLGLFLSAVLALVSSEFRGGLGLDGSVWKAIFVLTSVLSGAATIGFGIQAMRAKANIETILAALRKGSLLIRDGVVQRDGGAPGQAALPEQTPQVDGKQN